MGKLISNELMKMMLRRKLVLIFFIELIVVSAFAYGLNNQYQKSITAYTKSNGTTYDWTPSVKQEINTLQNQLKYGSNKAEDKKVTSIQINQYKYYLQYKMSPLESTGMKFAGIILSQSVMLLLPLLIILFSGDAVSSEFSARTIKILLTRAIPRWKILLSKYIATILVSAMVTGEMGILSVIIGKITFHTWGFMEPVAVTFHIIGKQSKISNVVELDQWQYLLVVCALCVFVAVVIASISFTVSIFVKNTAASIGIMMASLIGGSILQIFINDWPRAKYFFAVNLGLPQYLSAQYENTAGMNLEFSMVVLLIWAIVSLVIGFYVFIKQDVLV